MSIITLLVAIQSVLAIQVLKLDAKAARGACMFKPVTTKAEAYEVLSPYRVRMINARPEETIALANGMAQITALNGGVFKPLSNTFYYFKSRKGYSRYAGYLNGRHNIHMNRCFSNGRGCRSNNVAHMMHELGHQLGWIEYRPGENYYQAYRRHTKSCYPTRYSRSRNNEQFAEVFAAFITRPEILKKNSSCKKAYGFFAKAFKNGHLASCHKSKMNRLKQKFAVIGTDETITETPMRVLKPALPDRAPARESADKKETPRVLTEVRGDHKVLQVAQESDDDWAFDLENVGQH